MPGRADLIYGGLPGEGEGLDLLGVGAHPDDVEIGAGATLALHGRRGYSTGLLDLTSGELSSNGTVTQRLREAAHSAEILGARFRAVLGFKDGQLYDEPSLVEGLVHFLRAVRPAVVLLPHERDRHPDHADAARLVRAALFKAKLRRYLPDSSPHKVSGVFSYAVNSRNSPDLLLAVTPQIHELKMRALQAYHSQFESAVGERVATPLTQNYLGGIEARGRYWGWLAGCEFAEGFWTDETPVCSDLVLWSRRAAGEEV